MLERNYHSPFFENIRLNVPKNPARLAEVSFCTNFFFCTNFLHIFSLPLSQRKIPLPSFPFSHRKSQKPHVKRSPTNFFLGGGTFLHATAPRARKQCTTYLFFTKLRLRVPKNPAKRAQVSFFLKITFFPP